MWHLMIFRKWWRICLLDWYLIHKTACLKLDERFFCGQLAIAESFGKVRTADVLAVC